MDLLGGVASGLGTLTNFASDLITNNANRIENDKSRAYNTQMWQMQNQYNSPEQQMVRLKQAGLNPNLAYGGGAAVTGNASPVAPGSPVHYNAPKVDTGQIIQANLAQQSLQTEKNNTRIKSAQADALEQINDMLFNRQSGSQVSSLGPVQNSDPLWLKLQKAKAQSGLANASSAQSLADINSRLRQYNMTANDSIYARMMVGDQSGKLAATSLIGDMLKNLWSQIKGAF